MPATANGIYGSLVTNGMNIREIAVANNVSIGGFEAGETLTVKMVKKYYNF